MKIEFEDKSYIEITKSHKPDTIILTIAARNKSNSLSTISNSVELTKEQLDKLLNEIR